MSPDYDIKIKSLFDQAREDRPDEKFIYEVMYRVRQQERKTRLYMLGCLVAALPVLWLLSSDLEALVVDINGFAVDTYDYTFNLLTQAGFSPITWIFLVPLTLYILYINRRRLI